MKIEFSNKDLTYLYNTLLENLEKLEEHKTLNRQDIKEHKKLISILESASPELKDIKALRYRYQDQKNQSQKA